VYESIATGLGDITKLHEIDYVKAAIYRGEALCITWVFDIFCLHGFDSVGSVWRNIWCASQVILVMNHATLYAKSLGDNSDNHERDSCVA